MKSKSIYYFSQVWIKNELLKAKCISVKSLPFVEQKLKKKMFNYELNIVAVTIP